MRNAMKWFNWLNDEWRCQAAAGCLSTFSAMGVVVMLLCILLTMCSCKTHERLIVRTDTCYRDRYLRDSISIHDSIYLHEYSKGETIYIERERWRTQYRDRITHDSIYIATRDTIRTTISVPRQLTWWQQTQIRLGWLFLIICALWGAWRFVRKRYG